MRTYDDPGAATAAAEAWMVGMRSRLEMLCTEAVLFGRALSGDPRSPVAWSAEQWQEWAWPNPAAQRERERAAALSYIGAVPS